MKPKRNIHLPRPSSRMENVGKWSAMCLVMAAAGFLLYLIMTGQIDEIINEIVH